jgi:hypothetical protein
MLNSIYTLMFRPSQIRASNPGGMVIGVLAILVWALNAAGAAHLGVGGVVAFFFLFFIGGCLGWYWLSASVHLIAQLLGGHGQSGETLQAIARGLWPVLLTGPAIAATHWSLSLGAVFALSLTAGTMITITGAIRQVHQFRWLQAYLCLLISLGMSALAITGLVLWPLMLFLGT